MSNNGYFSFRKLPNPVYGKETEVCLVVKDLEKGWKKDHEPTTQHFKELLDANNIDCISQVLFQSP